jgi:hypothetical protein
MRRHCTARESLPHKKSRLYYIQVHPESRQLVPAGRGQEVAK